MKTLLVIALLVITFSSCQKTEFEDIEPVCTTDTTIVTESYYTIDENYNFIKNNKEVQLGQRDSYAFVDENGDVYQKCFRYAGNKEIMIDIYNNIDPDLARNTSIQFYTTDLKPIRIANIDDYIYIDMIVKFNI